MPARKSRSREEQGQLELQPAARVAELVPDVVSAEAAAERALRPKTLAEYEGQPRLREQLELFIGAARARQEALDHVLLFGPPGLGKTTLAQIIAAELGVNLRSTSGPVLEKPKDLAALLTSLEPRDVLFIDEIHRMPVPVAEVLYGAMEDYKLDILVGQGDTARSIQVPLHPFTLVGATTRAGMLTGPLRDRFGITGRLEFYSAEDLSRITTRSAGLLGLRLSPEAARAVACRARGTPRIANRLLRRLRDVADVRQPGREVQADFAQVAMDLLGVDPAGLDVVDRRLLTAMAEHYNGGPVGLETLAAITGEAPDTLEDAVEPYLMQQGFLQRTPRGRVLTDRARAHLAASQPGEATHALA